MPTARSTDVEHRDGCPKGANRRDIAGEPVGTSIETYPVTRPNGQAATVTRCVDCGAQTVTDQKGAA